MAFFNSKKYLSDNRHTPMVDGSDALANANQIITFYQVNGDRSIPFKAFITTYNETWNSDWSQETVYGRSDPIYMFKQNTRQITLAFKLPAATAGEAYENLTKVQRLVQFIYPSYSSVSTGEIPAQTISRSPLVRLNILGLTQKQLPSSAARGITARDPSQAPINPSRPDSNVGAWNDANGEVLPGPQGLLGAIANLNVNYNLESTDYGVFQPSELNGAILPKLIEVNLSFNVIHEFTVGWGDDNDFASKTYPFNVNILEDGFYPDPPDQNQSADGATSGTGTGESLLAPPEDAPRIEADAEEADEQAVPPGQVADNEEAGYFSLDARQDRIRQRAGDSPSDRQRRRFSRLGRKRHGID